MYNVLLNLLLHLLINWLFNLLMNLLRLVDAHIRLNQADAASLRLEEARRIEPDLPVLNVLSQRIAEMLAHDSLNSSKQNP